MEHTFLFEPGLWISVGQYFDEEQNTVGMKGTTRIIHGEKEWRHTISTILDEEGAEENVNVYIIEPFVPGIPATGWESDYPLLGKITGQYVTVGDSIIGCGQTEDGQYQVVETLQQKDENHYFSKGALFKERQIVSSWTAEMTRTQ